MFKYIVLISALLLACCAAFFSVTGIAQLFVGAIISAGIMAASLELGKIIGVSFLYRNWKIIPKFLKYYLMCGSIVLMMITSAGIYGYLSSAYADGAQGIKDKQNQITLLTQQEINVTQSINRNSSRVQQLQSIQSQQENRLDSLVSHNRATGTQQTIVRENNKEIIRLTQELSFLNNQKDSLEIARTNVESSIGSSGKIGTFYYISKILNISMDTIIKWFILIIVLVFDPLSISLFLAYNILDKKNTSSVDLVESTKDTPLEISKDNENRVIHISENKMN